METPKHQQGEFLTNYLLRSIAVAEGFKRRISSLTFLDDKADISGLFDLTIHSGFDMPSNRLYVGRGFSFEDSNLFGELLSIRGLESYQKYMQDLRTNFFEYTVLTSKDKPGSKGLRVQMFPFGEMGLAWADCDINFESHPLRAYTEDFRVGYNGEIMPYEDAVPIIEGIVGFLHEPWMSTPIPIRNMSTTELGKYLLVDRVGR